MGFETIVMPEIFIARALGETQKIRLGPAPVCLNMHHPFHVASRLAFLDHLSKGRLNLCFGPGSVAGDMEPYGLDSKNSSRMVAESIDIILGLWAADPPYEYDGEFWKIHITEKFDDVTKVGYIKKPEADSMELIWSAYSPHFFTARGGAARRTGNVMRWPAPGLDLLQYLQGNLHVARLALMPHPAPILRDLLNLVVRVVSCDQHACIEEVEH